MSCHAWLLVFGHACMAFQLLAHAEKKQCCNDVVQFYPDSVQPCHAWLLLFGHVCMAFQLLAQGEQKGHI